MILDYLGESSVSSQESLEEGGRGRCDCSRSCDDKSKAGVMGGGGHESRDAGASGNLKRQETDSLSELLEGTNPAHILPLTQ